MKIENCDAGEFAASINSPEYKLQGKNIILRCRALTDCFNAPDGTVRIFNAPLLLRKTDNTKPFTFSAQVTPVFRNIYDAGALYIYCNNELWQKFAYEMDEKRRTRIVTVRTVGTSDDNNHDTLAQEGVWMKISSDTKNIGFYYSTDGRDWQMVRLYHNRYPEKIYLAISTQSPVGTGTEAVFTNIEFAESSIENFRIGI